MSRERWKKQDRAHPPCANCGEELYDQFWGDGGWVPAEKATDEMHSERRCLRRLKMAMMCIGDDADALLDGRDLPDNVRPLLVEIRDRARRHAQRSRWPTGSRSDE